MLLPHLLHFVLGLLAFGFAFATNALVDVLAMVTVTASCAKIMKVTPVDAHGTEFQIALAMDSRNLPTEMAPKDEVIRVDVRLCFVLCKSRNSSWCTKY